MNELWLSSNHTLYTVILTPVLVIQSWEGLEIEIV
jgi:hypothetical protein